MRLKRMQLDECEEMAIGNMSTHRGRIGVARFIFGTKRASLLPLIMWLTVRVVTCPNLSDYPIR